MGGTRVSPLVKLAAAAVALLACAPAEGTVAAQRDVACDIIVCGGSLSSLAAAITAANASDLTVCLTDPTDWPGGQLTASAVPAIDNGPPFRLGPAPDRNPRALEDTPASLASLLYGPLMPGTTNLGGCWVSNKCSLVTTILSGWLAPLLASLPNLRLFPMTAITGTTRDPATGRIVAVQAVQRTPAAGTSGWEALTSAQLADWYDPVPSAAFPAKAALNLTLTAPLAGGAVIEATEWGDVLVTSGLPFAQGAEAPLENSTSYLGGCGQPVTVPFFLTYADAPVPFPDPVPAGIPGASGWSMQNFTWERTWSYRRLHAADADDLVRPGETTVFNVGWGGNDYDDAYILLPPDSAAFKAQLAQGAWRGGVNTTTLRLAEQRSFAAYHAYKAIGNATGHAAVTPYLTLNASQAGTASGLAKMPYMRDSRRAAAGLGGFRFTYADMAVAGPGSGGRTASRWNDTVGLGDYYFADIHALNFSAAGCTYPAYIPDRPGAGAPILPYYLPFRALTVAGAPNLLVAGKSLSQTFWASAATRLHPEEWATGTAAGAAAVLMRLRGWSATQDVLDHVGELQALLLSPAVASPLEWAL